MKNDSAPLISIVVPTRNRHFYLAILARSLLAMPEPDFELVVHDNSDAPGGFEAATGKLADPRLRYVYDPTQMSITQNFEKALTHARGEYVCMIGDDDGVTEAIFGVARWLKAHGIEAATTPVATYLWPGVESALNGKQTTGILRMPWFTSRIRLVDAKAALEVVLASGAIRIGELPCVYQGIVSRQALERLNALSGTRFPGPSPDMANAVGLSAVIDRFARISFPVVISGSCNVSGAAEGARHQHHGEIADKAFLPPDTASRWPSTVPFYFSGPTLWAATLIHALIATGRGTAAQRLRYDRLYAACSVFTPKYRDRVALVRRHHPALVSSAAFSWSIAWIWHLRARALIGNIWSRLQARLFSPALGAAVPDIEAAIGQVSATAGPLPQARFLPSGKESQ